MVDNPTILKTNRRLLCTNLLQLTLLWWDINIIYIYIYIIVMKSGNFFHRILNYNDILIIVIFQIEVSSINFSHKFRIYALFVYSVTIFPGSQRIPLPLFLDFDLPNHL